MWYNSDCRLHEVEGMVLTCNCASFWNNSASYDSCQYSAMGGHVGSKKEHHAWPKQFADLNPPPPVRGIGSVSPRFFLNNVCSVTSIDSKLGILLYISIARPYTKFWTIFLTFLKCYNGFSDPMSCNMWSKIDKCLKITKNRHLKQIPN